MKWEKLWQRQWEKIRQDRQEDLKTRMGEYVLENRKLMEERFWQELLRSKTAGFPGGDRGKGQTAGDRL